MQNGDISMQKCNPEESDISPDDDNAYPFGPDGIETPAPPSHKQWINIGVFVLMLIAMVAAGLVVTAANEKKTSTLTAQYARFEESTKGRSEVLRTWIDSWLLASRRLTGSDLVRLCDRGRGLPAGSPLPRSLLDQRPYFQALMAEFAEQNDLIRATMIDGNGRLLLGSSGPTIDVANILDRVSKAPEGWEKIILPIRPIAENANDLVIDVLVPMPRVQTTGVTADDNVAILIQTIPAPGVLNDLLTISSTSEQSEKIYLLQERDGLLEKISLSKSGVVMVRPMKHDQRLLEQALISDRSSMIDGQFHYVISKKIPGSGWTIAHAIEAQAALAAVNRFTLAITGIAITIVLATSICFAAFWWRRTSVHHQELMLLYRSFADRLDKKRRFLAAITSSISDWLAVMNEEKRYIYVNPAFAAALDLPKAKILGQRMEDLLPMERFTPPGDAFDELVSDDEVSLLQIGDRQHLVATTWSDLRDQTGHTFGTVSVMRDQTELVEQRQQRILALTETIDAFIHTIERRDPFLLGHTCRLRTYAIAVGRMLDLDDERLTGIALAASLSQIGKIFIPDEILIKPKRHNQQEAEVMRSHIGHALSILSRIDFGFPVVDILSQMHERLDGSGYPNGLAGDDIDLPGRILGAADVFCARTAPRSYRERMSAGNALFHLANNASRYDVKVIAALAKIVSQEGELNSEDFDGNFLDSRVWENVDHQPHTVDVGLDSDSRTAAMAI